MSLPAYEWHPWSAISPSYVPPGPQWDSSISLKLWKVILGKGSGELISQVIHYPKQNKVLASHLGLCKLPQIGPVPRLCFPSFPGSCEIVEVYPIGESLKT